MSTSAVLTTLMRSGKPVAVGKDQIEALDSEIKKLEAEFGDCCSLEFEYAQALNKKRAEAESEKDALERMIKWGKPVSILDLNEALHWRDTSGFPRIVVFSVGYSEMRVYFKYTRRIPSMFSRKQVDECLVDSYDSKPPQFWDERVGCFNDLKDRWLAEGKAAKIGFKEWFRVAADKYNEFSKRLTLSAVFHG